MSWFNNSLINYMTVQNMFRNSRKNNQTRTQVDSFHQRTLRDNKNSGFSSSNRNTVKDDKKSDLKKDSDM